MDPRKSSRLWMTSLWVAKAKKTTAVAQWWATKSVELDKRRRAGPGRRTIGEEKLRTWGKLFDCSSDQMRC
jgi:hypothetical protein